MAKMLLSHQRCAYFRMSYLMFMMTHYNPGPGPAVGAMAVPAAGSASPGPPRALSERSAAASSDSGFGWQKTGSGEHASAAVPSLHSRNGALASARCIFRYIIASHHFETVISNVHLIFKKIGSAEHAPAALVKLLSRNRALAPARRTFLYVIKMA